jgi:periplasmic protein TonB
MFEHSLIDLAATKRPRRRWLSLPAAVMIHMGAFGVFMLSSYWQVEAVPAPPMMDIFYVSMEPPAPPPSLGTGKPATTKPEVVVKKEEVKPVTPQETVQPEMVADLKPVAQTGSSVLDNVLPAGGNLNGVKEGGVDTGGDLDSDARYSLTVAPPPVVVPTPQPVNDAPIQVGGAVLKPEVIARTEPRYTELARKARVEGVVVLRAIIDERGYVTNVELLRGQPMGLDQAAMDAVRTWRFKPATLHGQPVKVYFNLTVNFTLQR